MDLLSVMLTSFASGFRRSVLSIVIFIISPHHNKECQFVKKCRFLVLGAEKQKKESGKHLFIECRVRLT